MECLPRIHVFKDSKKITLWHIFHYECLKKIVKKVCPLDRRKIGNPEECDEDGLLYYGFGYSILFRTM